MMQSTRRRFRVDRRRIGFLKFVFEAYEGVAVVRTVDSRLGVVELAIGPGCEPIARDIIRDLGRRFRIEPMQEQGPGSDRDGMG